MHISYRFSRLRDGSLRLRVTGVGDDAIDGLSPMFGGNRSKKVGEAEWRTVITLGESRLAAAVTDLRAAGGELAELADRISSDLTRLAAVQVARVVAPARGPVVDDAALRAAVRSRPPTPAALVIDELAIPDARADLAVLEPGCWTGIEVKGETDSLARLPRQVRAYSALFDRCELVTTDRHAEKAEALLPDWWQVTVAAGDDPDDVNLTVRRPGTVNPDPSAFARAQLLWREEAVTALAAAGRARGLSKLSRGRLWLMLAELHDPTAMRDVVDGVLRARQNWLLDDGRGRVGLG